MTKQSQNTRADSEGASRALLTLGRTAGLAVVDAQEATSRAVADYEDSLAASSRIRWVAAGVGAQARLTRNVVDRYASRARALLA